MSDERPFLDSFTADVLRSQAGQLRATAVEPVTTELDCEIMLALAEGIEAQVAQHRIWCILCGSVDGVPRPGPTKPGECSCGATELPDVVVVGILGDLDA